MGLDSLTVVMPEAGDFVESHHSNHNEVEFREANFRIQTSCGNVKRPRAGVRLHNDKSAKVIHTSL